MRTLNWSISKAASVKVIDDEHEIFDGLSKVKKLCVSGAEPPEIHEATTQRLVTRMVEHFVPRGAADARGRVASRRL